MSRTLIGRTLRRLRLAQGLTQQRLAQLLGISISYLNLMEHDQRPVTASLLFKLTEVLKVDLAALSGTPERALEVSVREVFTDPLLGIEPVPEAEMQALAASAPNAARAILTLHRAWAAARADSDGIILPSGRKIMPANDEVRDYFHTQANHFESLEQAAEGISAALPAGLGQQALAERLRRGHGLVVSVQPMPGAHRVFDAKAKMLRLSEALPAESRGFQMAFQLALLEAQEAVDPLVKAAGLSSRDAGSLLRIGLLNYVTGAILMPYDAFLAAARELRYDIEALSARFGVSYEQTCHRLSTLQRVSNRGVPFFFLRVDPAGNVSKRFSASSFPFMRFGGTCPRWIVHTAFTTPGTTRVQVAQLPEGDAYLCIARALTGRPARWGEPPPMHVVAIGCDLTHRDDIVYHDGLNTWQAAVGIGLSCRTCDRPDCRSRAFPPLAHRLQVDTKTTSAVPYVFKAVAEE